MGRSDLERLSKEELIEVVQRLQRPQKTSRTSGRFTEGRAKAVAALRRASVVAADETGVRIEGSNAYH